MSMETDGAPSGPIKLRRHLQVSFKQGEKVRWLLVDPVSQGLQGYHDPYFTNQVRLASTS